MPPSFDEQQYWHERFKTETSFEWLISSEAFLSILEPHLERLHKSSRILQVGFGTSDLQNHLRARGFNDILNIDYEPLAIEHGLKAEQEAFGDVRMRYAVADATQLESFPEQYDLVIDKSTVDAISCGGQEAFSRMFHGVKNCLARGGFWLSLSYSSSRFAVDDLPFDVEVIERIPTSKAKTTDPDIFYYCYLLRPKHGRP
ncbi:hypothetical protein M406DRAFT_332407 [Cryphonectria parasitica EP155]|uniref:Methyltransferase domain-containing protein n=1 Tax=Cryphonectria parasitica (strain ATCC 38755 / EP155) TaxID=660469 RepID=A0A9P5CNJ0_CRYP1|nr:uncharacterized protein M406DRAFT_332407 [Cryphonectria parasitica EP155]KAF3763970.1 hypothetical protein M406DRAFT_332407 [Cryphonectria parasitica EP155]